VADWATPDDVNAALGGTATDTEFLTACTDAANAYAFRRRLEAGYVDDELITPGPDVTMGVVMYAVSLYRERGSVDSYASFDAFASGVMPSSTYGQVNRLLGVPRGQVDAPPTGDELARIRVRRQHARWFA